LAFDAVLEGLREAGLVPRRGKQRLDSTHVLGLVAKMSRLECVRETLRLALLELARREDLPRPSLPECWPLLWERYVEGAPDYRADEATLAGKLSQAGADALCLLRWVEALAPGPAPHPASAGRQVLLLRRVFDENFEPQAAPAAAEAAPILPAAPPAGTAAATTEAEAQAEAQARAGSASASRPTPTPAAPAGAPRRAPPAGAGKKPHDPDARWSVKCERSNGRNAGS